MFDIVSKSRTPDENKALLKLTGAFYTDPKYAMSTLSTDDELTKQARSDLGAKLFTLSTTRWFALLLATEAIVNLALEFHGEGTEIPEINAFRKWHAFKRKNILRLTDNQGRATISGDNLWLMVVAANAHIKAVETGDASMIEQVLAEAHKRAADYLGARIRKSAPMVVNGEDVCDWSDPELNIKYEQVAVEEFVGVLKSFSNWALRLKERDILKYGVEVW